jgi:predicted CXXCH cytochrome family protein
VVASQTIPLWNKTTTATGSFSMYTNITNASANLQGTVDASPTGASMACFTCHDGTQAVGNMINLPNDIATVTYTAGGQLLGTGLVSGTALLGKDLTNDHPISITYQDDLDTGLKAPAGLVGVKLFPTNTRGSKVQCASCHDVHNSTLSPFLRVTMDGSALCTSCHVK